MVVLALSKLLERCGCGVLESGDFGSRIADFGLKELQSDQIILKIHNPQSQIRNRIAPIFLNYLAMKLPRRKIFCWAIILPKKRASHITTRDALFNFN
jgi:hypothetical protein